LTNIELREVRFRYPGGPEVLRGISISISGGEVVGLMGPSGAGKSSLARHLNGLLRPSSGQVLLNGQDTCRMPVAQLARSVGYVFQNPLHQLFASTVRDEVALGLRAQAVGGSERDARVQATLRRFNLAPFAERHPLALSEGQRKRVALAAVLATEPRILVLDEPTLGQDAVEKAHLRDLIAGLRERASGVLVITHDAEFALECCQRLAVMQEGRLRLDAPIAEAVQDEQAFLAARLVPPQIPSIARALGWSHSVLSVEQALQAMR
jgi:energy-coupling factor transporter ATP-binding protein EcfA2